MSPRGLHSPSDQIEALTKGVRLPFPSLEPEHLEVILEMLQAAFHDVATNYMGTLIYGNEPEINALMEARLNALLMEADHEASPAMLWRQLVNAVARGKETVIYNGERIEKRPDLNILFNLRHPSFPLVVECKMIDRHKDKSPRLYCDDGVARFLRGEYGWGTREAVMLGYVRDESSLTSSLAPLLSHVNGIDRYAVRQPLQAVRPSPPDIACSVHERRFRYVGRLSPDDDPGNISIWHLWMVIPQPDVKQ